jgi:hypothetical protein
MQTPSKVILALWVTFLLAVPAVTAHAAGDKNKKLVEAVDDGNVNGVKNLLAQGANPNYVVVPGYHEAYGGDTVLMVAAWPYAASAKHDNHLQIIKILLAHGANVNAVNGGRTALICAVEHGRLDIVALLLKSGAINTINARLGGGKTALGVAIERAKRRNNPNMAKNDAEIINLLRQHGAKE